MAVGDRLDQRRTAAGTGPVDSLPGHRVHGLHVVAVDDEILEPISRCAVGRRALDRGDRSDRGVLHVLVVLADEDDRRLPHDRQVQRLVERPDVRRPVAEEADRDLAAPAVLRGPGRPDRDRQMGADDRVRPHRAVLDGGEVHGSALAAHQRALLADELEEHRLHRYAAGKRVVVAAVRAEGVIVFAHGGGEPGRDRLLADPEVRRPADQPGEEELVGALLEEAAGEHRAVHPHPQVAVEVGRGGVGRIGHQ